MVKTPAAVNKLTAEFVRLASSDARLCFYSCSPAREFGTVFVLLIYRK